MLKLKTCAPKFLDTLNSVCENLTHRTPQIPSLWCIFTQHVMYCYATLRVFLHNLFGCFVFFAVILFPIYSVIWIRSNGPAR